MKVFGVRGQKIHAASSTLYLLTCHSHVGAADTVAMSVTNKLVAIVNSKSAALASPEMQVALDKRSRG